MLPRKIDSQARIEYTRDGERLAVYFDSDNPELPVRERGGAIRFYRWGARSAQYFSPDNLGGYAANFPETCCASLTDIRAGKWTAMHRACASSPRASFRLIG